MNRQRPPLDDGVRSSERHHHSAHTEVCVIRIVMASDDMYARIIKRLMPAAFVILTFPAVSAADPVGYVQTNLASDVPGLAENVDPLLKNPWGMSFGLNSPFWISDQHANVSTLYTALGVPQSLVVGLPPSPGGGPTGQVFAGGQGFTTNTGTQATVIMATLDGTIDAWSGGASAVTQATTPGAVYTGLALAGGLLYAADAAQGQIDVFNSSFQKIQERTI